ncbi:MAG: MgtC/SapB family protein [Gammaproteobacteria bacterium]|nr:MgtC/SapB family protein [Gammaproteobacteria bacterium]
MIDFARADLLRLAAAVVLSFPISWDRERHTHIMGMRTFSLVAVGACAYVLVVDHFVPPDAYDARARVMQGLLSGIGFLGAGAILKRSDEVRGTATAASIWLTGALGAAVGHGQYLLAGALSITAYLVLKVMSALQQRHQRARAHPHDKD